MCGIAGVCSLQPVGADRPYVEEIVRAQRRRGPDGDGIEVMVGSRLNAVFGHNRLAIIDLTLTGAQPMWDHAGRVCIVYNGEIYNYVELRSELCALGHRFAGTSDTEVILEAFKRWGTDAFARFNGMFAFALFDRDGDHLYLVRDRFGVKPLYYVPGRDRIDFASTCGSMARHHGLQPDPVYLASGVHYGLYEHGEAAPFIGMRALPPGHWLRLAAVGAERLDLTLQRFYDLQGRVEALVESLAGVSIRKAVDSLDELLTDAVRIRLRADVPVALSLSGGLDSSSIAAIAAAQLGDRVRGFTFGAPDVPASEGPAARNLAGMTGIEVTYVWPTTAEVCRALDETVTAQVGPFPNASIVAQHMVFAAARAAGFKVLLGGQGADESYMGYRKFQAFRLRQLIAGRRHVEALTFAVSLLPTVVAERQHWIDGWRNRDRYLRRTGLSTILNLPEVAIPLGMTPAESLRGRQILDMELASLATLLRYEDSNSMDNSVESRLPFLDYRLAEFGIALPESLKLRNGHGKWILRQAMAGRIPDSIRTNRVKKGFDVHQSRWIDEGFGAHIRRRLHESAPNTSTWLPPGADVDALFSDDRLKRRPMAFTEAATLIWLSARAAACDRICVRPQPPGPVQSAAMA
jgi:asparagine synthase (glutamine-hydrolysing)